MQRYLIYLIFTAVFLVLHFTGVLAGQLPYIQNALITFSAVLAVLLLLDAWYSGTSLKTGFKNLGFRKTRLSLLAPGIIISLVLLLLYPLSAYILKTDIFLNEDWLLNSIGIFLTGGLAEEMFFRGFLFRHFREKMSFRKAVFASMLLFTLAHLILFTYKDWSIALLSTILAVAISIPLAYLFERSNHSVWSPAIVHATIRTIGLVITTSEQHFMPLTLIWIVGSMLIPYFVLLFYKDFWNIWKSL